MLKQILKGTVAFVVTVALILQTTVSPALAQQILPKNWV